MCGLLGFFVPLKIGDSTFKMYVEVRHDANMKKMYVHEVVLREDNSTPAFKIPAASQKEAEPQSAKRGAIFSFIRDLRNVNASKVVDENGEPLVVYHGTTKDFNIFNTPSFLSENSKVAGDFSLYRLAHSDNDGY